MGVFLCPMGNNDLSKTSPREPAARTPLPWPRAPCTKKRIGAKGSTGFGKPKTRASERA